MENEKALSIVRTMCNEKADDGIVVVEGVHSIPCASRSAYTVYESMCTRALATLVKDLLERVEKLENPVRIVFSGSATSIVSEVNTKDIKRNDIVCLFHKQWRVDHVDGGTLLLSNDDNEVYRCSSKAVTLVEKPSNDKRIDDIVNRV